MDLRAANPTYSLVHGSKSIKGCVPLLFLIVFDKQLVIFESLIVC
jgi:hypothetical protein